MAHIIIGDVAPVVVYQGDGVTKIYPYSFPVFEEEDITVYFGSVQQTSGFTVSGAGRSDGGTVTFASAPADGVTVTLVRAMTIKRLTDYQLGGAFYADVINTDFDRLTAVQQDLAASLARAVKVPLGSQETPETMMEALLVARDQSVSAGASATVSQGAAAASAASASMADAGAAASAAAVATDRAVVEARAAEVATHWAEVEASAGVVAASETAAVAASTSAQADAATAQAASDSAQGAAATASAAAVLAGASADAAAISEGIAEDWAAQAAVSAGAAAAAGGGTVTQITTGAGLTGGPVTVSGEIAADIATQAEAEAGTEAAKLMTPERTAQAIAALVGGGGGGAFEVIASGVGATGDLIFTNVDSDFYVAFNVVNGTAGGSAYTVTFSTDNGATYRGSGYRWARRGRVYTGGATEGQSLSDTKIYLGFTGGSFGFSVCAMQSATIRSNVLKFPNYCPSATASDAGLWDAFGDYDTPEVHNAVKFSSIHSPYNWVAYRVKAS
jgi:hypothetical protein